jgi:ferric-dicitrate binding protein FerR (iron transport regulator)
MSHPEFNRYRLFSARDFASDNDFVRYVCKPSPADIDFWQLFLDYFPEKKPTVREASLLILALQPDTSKISPGEEADLWATLSEHHDDFFRKKQNDISEKRIKRFFLATFISLSLLLGTIFFSIGNKEVYTYHTGFNQVATLFLPDSSIVRLNANSTLKVWSSGFFEKKREIMLNGEAHFKVKKSLSFGNYQKMLVHTPSGTVEVTGTIFNVYARGNKTKVYLKEGEVKMNHLPDLPVILLKPGDYIQYDRQEKTLTKGKIASEVMDAWISDKIIFERTALPEVFNHIRDIHGWGYVLMNPSLAEKSFTGVLPVNDLDLLLKALEEVFNVYIEKKDKILVVKIK